MRQETGDKRRETLVLTQRDVARLIDLREAIRTTREAFKAMARGEAVMPPKLYLPLPRGSDFRAMPAYLTHPPACGVKWVSVHPHNRARGRGSASELTVFDSTGLAVHDIALGAEVVRWARRVGIGRHIPLYRPLSPL